MSDVLYGMDRLKRGQVWCRKCGLMLRLEPSYAMRCGWPKCHGETMTIDSPDEQKLPAPPERKV